MEGSENRRVRNEAIKLKLAKKLGQETKRRMLYEKGRP